MIKNTLYILFVIQITLLNAQDRYAEIYRPQYHASPRTGFMGDPNGPMKFGGQYRLFWWGHMVSDDMVYWQELNSNALLGTPSGFGNWSGSVLMDIENTAGFNTSEDTAMIAVYTLNQNSNGHQHQAISISINSSMFEYYENNPVIEGNQPDFRDPQVFWHEPTSMWVMVITKPIDRAIEFYTSSDLKNWTYRSKFQGRGARKEVWEVPDLFQLPVNGSATEKQWVLICGMGPNRMQHWIGDFDGDTFTLSEEDNLITGKHIEGLVFTDFEADYAGWTIEGEAFGAAPAAGALPDQQEVVGYTGYKLVNSFHNGDASTGKMISPEFIVEKRFITFQIGGGTGGNMGFKVVVDGQDVHNITSTSNTEILQWRSLDMSAFTGKTAHIEIFDDATGGWGHILVDHIVFSDFEYDTRLENANWGDWGHDFYAGKTFRNYDFDDDRVIWLAWMGNWTYARDVPTNPWKGCESIPRELSLIKGAQGYQLIQKPISELEKLRTDEYTESNLSINGTQSITGFQPEWNVYELKVSFRITRDNQVFGINLAEGTDRKVEVKFDTHNSVLSVDRGTKPFSFAFKRITKTPIVIPTDSILDLHIFMDQSSIEIFANDYKTSTTSLVFNDVLATGISLFSENGITEVPEFTAWNLESIWGITPDQMQRPEVPEEPEVLHNINGEKPTIYPNPVERGKEIRINMDYEINGIRLMDFTGRVHHQERSLGTDAFKVPDQITPGVYFLSVESSSGFTTQKIIIR